MKERDISARGLQLECDKGIIKEIERSAILCL